MALKSEASQNYVLLFLIACSKVVLVEGLCTGNECTNDISVEAAKDIAMKISYQILEECRYDRRNLTDTLQDIDRRFQEQEVYLKVQNTSLKNQFDSLQQNLQKIENTISEHNSQMQMVLENTTNLIKDFERRLQEHDQHSRKHKKLSNKQIKEVRASLSKPKDCSDIRATGENQSGVYEVYLNSTVATRVFCDMKRDGSSWLVFQRRINGSVDFYRTWNVYANGFGDPSGEFWLGNDNLYLLTSNRNYKLRVELETFRGSRGFAEYSTFSVGSSADKYRLTVSGYSGNAGDSMAVHNGQQFTTKDSDNDSHTRENCAVSFSGAWWYEGCYHANLNGLYLPNSPYEQPKGIVWRYWHSVWHSLKAAQMKIAPV